MFVALCIVRTFTLLASLEFDCTVQVCDQLFANGVYRNVSIYCLQVDRAMFWVISIAFYMDDHAWAFFVASVNKDEDVINIAMGTVVFQQERNVHHGAVL